MKRPSMQSICLGTLIGLAACGQRPPEAATAPDASGTLHGRFTAYVDPVNRVLSVIPDPGTPLLIHPALQHITEDQDGAPGRAAADTIEVYGATVTFTSTPAQYPAGCDLGAPMVMASNVLVTSGYQQQLRNLYMKMTAISGGQTFCASDSAGAFAADLGTHRGLYLYQPLDAGRPALSDRTWALNLPDNGAYWFTGEVWSEVIPAPLTAFTPASPATYAAKGNGAYNVKFDWLEDARANGSNPEGFDRPRPSGSSAYEIVACNALGLPTDPVDDAQCSGTPVEARDAEKPPVLVSLPSGPTGTWYRFRARPSFTIGAAPTRYVAAAWSATIYVLVTP